MPDPAKTEAALLDAAKDYGHRFADVVSYLVATGWKERVKGSHHIFVRTGFPFLINLQTEKSGKAKAYQIRQVRKAIEQLEKIAKNPNPKEMKNTIKDYPVQTYWDSRAGYFVAEILEIPTCSADGATVADAYANLEETFAVLKETYHEEKLPFPAPDSRLPVSVRGLSAAAQIVKVAQVAKSAGIPVQTLATKVRRGTEFSVGESHKIARVLSDNGVVIQTCGNLRDAPVVEEFGAEYRVHRDPRRHDSSKEKIRLVRSRRGNSKAVVKR